MSREAMKQPEALWLADVLDDESTQGRISNHNGRKAAVELRRLHEVNQDLLKALHEALETEQEPVAWISDSPTKGNGKQLHWTKSDAWRWSSNITPLYTAPQKKQLVGLTDEEVSDVIDNVLEDGGWLDVARAIEQALKEKNT